MEANHSQDASPNSENWNDLKNRLGVFTIKMDVIENNHLFIQQIMSKVIILRAEFLLSKDAVCYEAVSFLFDEINPGEMLPEYEILFINGKLEKAVKQPIRQTNLLY